MKGLIAAGFRHRASYRAVAVMRVKIPNGDALGALLNRIQRGDGDVAEITKAHGAIAHRVMTGRTHQTERALAFYRGARCIDGGAGGSQSMVVDVCMGGRVRIEIMRGFAYPRDVLARMRPQQNSLLRRNWFPPFPITMSIFQ